MKLLWLSVFLIEICVARAVTQLVRRDISYDGSVHGEKQRVTVGRAGAILSHRESGNFQASSRSHRHREMRSSTQALAWQKSLQELHTRSQKTAGSQPDNKSQTPSNEDIREYFAHRRQQSFIANAAFIATSNASEMSNASWFSWMFANSTAKETASASLSVEDLHEAPVDDGGEKVVQDEDEVLRREAEGGGRLQAAEVPLLDGDCRSRAPLQDTASLFSLPDSEETDTDHSTREMVWFLKHLEMIPTDIADSWLDLEGKHEERFRHKVSQGILSVKTHCLNPSFCTDIAVQIAHNESVCPKGRLLTRLLEQLADSWRKSLFAVDHTGTNPRLDISDDAALTSSQLVVKYWGRGLLLQHSDDPLTHLVDERHRRKAHRDLDLLLDAMLDPEADLLDISRIFLNTAQKQYSVTGTNVLLSLLRLMQEQRSDLTMDRLVRDAVAVSFYESRVSALELDAKSSLEDRSGDLDAVQYRMDALLEQLRRVADDHANVLPTDSGVLPAFWLGRLARVRRLLEDTWAGLSKPRPTVMIWTCSFGGGHWAATQALQQYLPDYALTLTDPTKDREFYEGDTVGDMIREYITPKWDETYLYNNVMLKGKHYKLENTVENLQSWEHYLLGQNGTRFAAPCAAPKCDYRSKQFMRRAMLQAAPDVVVTVYHMDLLPIMELAEELGNLPIIHLSTDVDTKMSEVFDSMPEYPYFKLGMPYPAAISTINPLVESQTFVSGYAVRTSFLAPLRTEQEIQVERLKRKIAKGALVVLVMSGSEGLAVPWPKQLADSETWEGRPLHIIVAVGGNDEFGKLIEASLAVEEQDDGHLLLRGTNRLITLEVAKDAGNSVGRRTSYFVPEAELAILMDIADALVTKGGGSTSAEAAYRGVPVLFDATDGMFKWEAYNAKMFEDYGRGKQLLDNRDLELDLRRVIALGKSRSLVLNSTGGLVDTRAQINSEIALMHHRASTERRLPHRQAGMGQPQGVQLETLPVRSTAESRP